MKKAIVCITLLLFLSSLSACGSEPVKHTREDANLIAPISSKEEAECIAEIYKIELVYVGSNAAEYYTEEEPAAVTERGKENGWPLVLELLEVGLN